MSDVDAVTESEARAMIERWGQLHDLQAGLSAFLPTIAEESFYMQFGSKRWVGYAAVGEHQINKRKSFDEVKEYLDVRVEVGDEVTIAPTRMRWSYRFRPEQSPRSQLVKAYMEHT